MLKRYSQSASRNVQRMLTCAIVITESSRMTRCAHDTGRVGVKSSALQSSVDGATHEAAGSRVQITSVVIGFALDLFTGAVTLHGNGFAAGTSRARDALRQAASRSTAHLWNLGNCSDSGTTATRTRRRARRGRGRELFESRSSKLGASRKTHGGGSARNCNNGRRTSLDSDFWRRAALDSDDCRGAALDCEDGRGASARL